MAQESLHFGATLPQIKRTWEEVRETAIAFDDCGFDSVWVCDHIYGVPLPTLPILEAWTLLAAVAAITEHVGLGTLVTPPFFRNPAVLAKQVATLHQRGDSLLLDRGGGFISGSIHCALDRFGQAEIGKLSHENLSKVKRWPRAYARQSKGACLRPCVKKEAFG